MSTSYIDCDFFPVPRPSPLFYLSVCLSAHSYLFVCLFGCFSAFLFLCFLFSVCLYVFLSVCIFSLFYGQFVLVLQCSNEKYYKIGRFRQICLQVKFCRIWSRTGAVWARVTFSSSRPPRSGNWSPTMLRKRSEAILENRDGQTESTTVNKYFLYLDYKKAFDVSLNIHHRGPLKMNIEGQFLL